MGGAGSEPEAGRRRDGADASARPGTAPPPAWENVRMSVEAEIRSKLRAAFDPVHLEVANESHMHSVPPGSESHFKLVIASPRFEGERLLGRHRLVNQALAAELAGPVHALAIHAVTPDEWFLAAGESPASPLCEGGSRAGGE